MKRIVIIGGIVIIGLLVMITSCDLLGITTSIEKRIKLFSDDIQAENYTILYTHLHDGTTQKNLYGGDETQWNNTIFGSDANPSAISVPTVTNSTAVSTFTSDSVELTLTFTMKKDGLHWFIFEIYIDDEVEPYIY